AVQTPYRRWRRFSLRSLFVVITILFAWLGMQANRAHQQRSAVAAIEKAGGSVHYDYQYDAKGQVSSASPPPGPEWLRKITGDDFFNRVVAVYSNPEDQGLTDEMIRDITPLTKLQGLHWFHCEAVTDKGLGQLNKLANLRSLGLVDCPAITDERLQ